MLEFEWDELKALSNLRKHCLSFEEAVTAFSDSLSLTIPDPVHSHSEHRFVLIGHSSKNKLVVVIHTERGKRFGSSVLGKRLARKGDYDQGK